MSSAISTLTAPINPAPPALAPMPERRRLSKSRASKSKAKWDGDVLKVMTTQDGANMTERYSLRDDSTMMLQIDRTGHQPETLYFQR